MLAEEERVGGVAAVHDRLVCFALWESAPTPFAYHALRGCVSLFLFGKQLAHVDVAQIDAHRPVNQTV